ncbi:hypothetical protein AeRB84_021141 [Aphanomyces euteiches]|nr:hypothetical protein AeRB84_021141 [Aphanomyces euteiches]
MRVSKSLQPSHSQIWKNGKKNELVWFLLVDGHGKAYKATRLSSVAIPSSYKIDQFKDAVFSKNTRKLSSLDSSDLIVFADKAALDAETPLEEDSMIGDYGVSKERALLVVVPTHELVSVPNQLITQATLKNLVANTVRDVMREEKRHKSGTSRSVDGEPAIQVLRRNNAFVQLDDKRGSVEIWGDDEQQRATAITSESLLVGFVTPYLKAILDDFGIVFENGEKNPWLRQHVDAKNSSTVCKPDGFATHAGMYCRNEDLRYGKIQRKLLDCLMIIEAKLSITNDSFGQVISFIQCVQDILIEDDYSFFSNAVTPLLLFDRHGFWLISSYCGKPVRVQTMKWIQPGSKEVLAKFFTSEIPIWVRLLNEARVFKVKSPNHAEPLALKIVPNKRRGHVPSLHSERQQLQDAAKSHVADTPVGDCKVLLDGLAKSLLLTPVGAPISRSELKDMQVLRSIFVALFRLHEAQCEHCYPRVDNLIRHKRKVLWVDFMSSFLSSSLPLDHLLIKGDIQCLIRSVLSLSHGLAIPQTVQPLVDEYSSKPTAETAQALADGVHAITYY